MPALLALERNHPARGLVDRHRDRALQVDIGTDHLQFVIVLPCRGQVGQCILKFLALGVSAEYRKKNGTTESYKRLFLTLWISACTRYATSPEQPPEPVLGGGNSSGALSEPFPPPKNRF